MVGVLPTIKPSLGGRGTARNERWMRDASDKLGLPDFVTLTIHRAHILGYISRERFLELGLSQFPPRRSQTLPAGRSLKS